MNKICVVLPAFNEELTIESTILDFHKYLPDASIFIINNASSDNTFIISEQVLKKNKIPGQVLNSNIKGKGNALKTAFSMIDADYYVVADADLTYPAKFSLEMIQIAKNENFDIVVGDRISNGSFQKENKRNFHMIGNYLVKSFINFIFFSNISDPMSGYRVLSNKFVKNYPFVVKGFEIESDMTMHAIDKGYSLYEYPIDYFDRPSGSVSKLNTFSDGLRVIFTIFKLFKFYKPFLFFNIFTVIFLISGLLSAIPVFYEYINYNYIQHIPLAILSMGFAVSSILTFTISILVDYNSYQAKLNYQHLVLLNENKKKYK